MRWRMVVAGQALLFASGSAFRAELPIIALGLFIAGASLASILMKKDTTP